MSQVKPERLVKAKRKVPDKDKNIPSSSSSKWETPISDTQAVKISNYLLTEQEAQEFLDEDEVQILNIEISG